MNTVNKFIKSHRYFPYLIYSIFFIIFTFIVIWKCRYGFANNDETFFLDIPYRYLQGDSLFFDELNPSQMASIFLIPILKLYFIIFQTTTGIYLIFRYIFTAVWTAFSLFLFFRLKKISFLGAAVSSLAVLVYTPHALSALSYSSMGIMFLLCACVITLTAEKRLAIQYLISGLFFSGAVICCPYLAVGYLFISVWALVYRIKLKNSKYSFQTDWSRFWIWFTCGIVMMIAVFCAVVFSRVSLNDFFVSLKYILMDSDRASKGQLSGFIMYFVNLVRASRIFPAIIIASVVVFIIAKVKPALRGICFIIMCAITFAAIIPCYFTRRFPDFAMIPLNILGLYCALICNDKTIRRFFWIVFIPGWFYTICNHTASNTGIYAVGIASTVSLVSSIMMIVLYTKNLLNSGLLIEKPHFKTLKKGIMISFAALFVFQLATEVYLKISVIYFETAPLSSESFLAEEGTESGILMTQERLDDYKSTMKDINLIKEDPNCQKILFLSQKTYLHLASEKELAAYSSWLSDGIDESTIERLRVYYEINPKKIPDTIFVDKEKQEYVNSLTWADYSVEQTSQNNYILYQNKAATN